MRYLAYKLSFAGPVRFGSDAKGAGLEKSSLACHADTFFSALCCEAAQWGGAAAVARLSRWVETRQLRLSDLYPYRGDDLYLPRPLLPAQAAREAVTSLGQATAASAQRKAMKKAAYLPLRQLDAYLAWLRQGGDCPLTAAEFGQAFLEQRVNTRGEQSLPYHVGDFRFYPDAGLYFLAALGPEADEAWLARLLESLGHSGLGGKKSSGCGRFALADDPWELGEDEVYPGDARLYAMLGDEEAPWQMALSVTCPAPEELDLLAGGQYLLVRRAGFVASAAYAPEARKRHGLHLLQPGSCLPGRLEGQLLDVAAGGAHAIYRYGKGLFVGVRP